MNGILSVLLRIALKDVAKALIATMAPSIRFAQTRKVSPLDLAVVFGHVALLAQGGKPQYGPLSDMTAEDVGEFSEAVFGVFTALVKEYKIALTNEQIGALLGAMVERMQAKFAPAA